MADDESSGMGTGMIIGILVILLVVVFLFFGRGFMGRGGGDGGSVVQQQTAPQEPQSKVQVPDKVDVNLNTPNQGQ